MALRLREVNAITIIDIDGSIDINSSEIVETVGWLVKSGKKQIILNLENVDLVDYSGLSILAVTYKNVINHNGIVKFLHVPLAVIELFKVVHLDVVFKVYRTEEDAVASFSHEAEIEEMHLRRKFKRLDFHLPVTYQLTGNQKSARHFTGEVLNMSAAGIYVYTTHTFPTTSVLALSLQLPHTATPLETQGRVVWLADRDLQPHAYPGMGVGFIHLTPQQEEDVIEFIDKNITSRPEPS